MMVWMLEVEETDEPSTSPRVLECETGLMKSGKSGRDAGSKAIGFEYKTGHTSG